MSCLQTKWCTEQESYNTYILAGKNIYIYIYIYMYVCIEQQETVNEQRNKERDKIIVEDP